MGIEFKKPTTKWRVGDWVACSATDTLVCGEASRKIERRAMETLMVLAERAGEVIQKDELIAHVWGRTAVSDHSVAMVISQLRRAFNDDARAPRYIQTITKRGYRLMVPAESLDVSPIEVPDTVPAQTRSTQQATSRRMPQAGTLFANPLVLACAGVALTGLGAASALLLF